MLILAFSFSRLVLWLEVRPTNKKPEQIAWFYIRAVETFGLPHTVRMDAGTENVNVRWAQEFLTADLPRLTALPPTVTGSSNHNEVKNNFILFLACGTFNPDPTYRELDEL